MSKPKALQTNYLRTPLICPSPYFKTVPKARCLNCSAAKPRSYTTHRLAVF